MPLHLRHGHPAHEQPQSSSSSSALEVAKGNGSPTNHPDGSVGLPLARESHSRKLHQQWPRRKRKRRPTATPTTRGRWTLSFPCRGVESIVLFFPLTGLLLLLLRVPHFGPTSDSYMARKALSQPEHALPHNTLAERTTTQSTTAQPHTINSNNSHHKNHTRVVSPLQYPVDFSNYTVRINTWQRPEQLQVVVAHYFSCDRVALVQVVWCTAQGPPPDWLNEWEARSRIDHHRRRLVVETHAENSLNARFDVPPPPPQATVPYTRGILSVDDDVLRPCLAMDAAFAKWTANPDRLVGFDARTHVVVRSGGKDPEESPEHRANHGERWKYGYLSETTRTNRYSLTLSRFAFVHVDHLRAYTTDDRIAAYRALVTKHVNCEDILLSLYISYRTQCQPPLLADVWASKSMIKLWSPQAISGTASHKLIRDMCVDTFAKGLQLDGCLAPVEWIHRDEDGRPSLWEAGAPSAVAAYPLPDMVTQWKEADDDGILRDALVSMVQEAALLPYQQGLMEGSPPWKEKYGNAQKVS